MRMMGSTSQASASRGLIIDGPVRLSVGDAVYVRRCGCFAGAFQPRSVFSFRSAPRLSSGLDGGTLLVVVLGSWLAYCPGVTGSGNWEHTAPVFHPVSLPLSFILQEALSGDLTLCLTMKRRRKPAILELDEVANAAYRERHYILCRTCGNDYWKRASDTEHTRCPACRRKRVCPTCSKEFSLDRFHPKQVYCSRACSPGFSPAARKARRISKPAKWVELTCQHCGTLFQRRAKNLRPGRPHFCSRACSDVVRGQDLGLQRKIYAAGGDPNQDPPAPDEAELARRCALERARWSEAERVARLRPDWRIVPTDFEKQYGVIA
jgi:hypothetical protein